MTIEITGLATPATPVGSETTGGLTARIEPASAQKSAANGQVQVIEIVTLSEFAKQLRDLENSLESVPVIDSEHVEQIKQSLKDGTYDFNAERVAVKYLQLETQLHR